jgi:prophage regulatory protein
MTHVNEIYLNVGQIAQRLNVSTDSIYRWKRAGDFPKATRLSSRTTRWRLSDVIAWESTRLACFAEKLEH